MHRYFILTWEGDDELHDLNLVSESNPDGLICTAEAKIEMADGHYCPRIQIDGALEEAIVVAAGDKWDGQAPTREQVMEYLDGNRLELGLYPRLRAKFRPQAWINDYATEVDGAVFFDATDKLLALDLDAIKGFEENNYDSDYLADGLTEREEHGGPFEVDTDLQGWFEAYGMEWKELTQEQLDWLRKVNPAPEKSEGYVDPRYLDDNADQ